MHTNTYLGKEQILKKGARKSENEVRKVFERIFNRKFKTTRPKWLNYKGNRLEIDGFNKEFNIGFEYQGEYHYEEIEKILKYYITNRSEIIHN